MKITEINRTLIINGIRLYDDEYREMGFFPDGENWALWAMYDDKDEIIEWYFDITKINALDENGVPYCEDMYLDIALTPDGNYAVLDEDELKNALGGGEITPRDFDTNRMTADR
jgi:predicted RNA-binding protein associated with RNAse of E/G family